MGNQKLTIQRNWQHKTRKKTNLCWAPLCTTQINQQRICQSALKENRKVSVWYCIFDNFKLLCSFTFRYIDDDLCAYYPNKNEKIPNEWPEIVNGGRTDNTMAEREKKTNNGWQSKTCVSCNPYYWLTLNEILIYYYMALSISALVSAWDCHIGPEGWYQGRYGKCYVIIYLSYIFNQKDLACRKSKNTINNKNLIQQLKTMFYNLWNLLHNYGFLKLPP